MTCRKCMVWYDHRSNVFVVTPNRSMFLGFYYQGKLGAHEGCTTSMRDMNNVCVIITSDQLDDTIFKDK